MAYLHMSIDGQAFKKVKEFHYAIQHCYCSLNHLKILIPLRALQSSQNHVEGGNVIQMNNFRNDSSKTNILINFEMIP